MLQAMLTKEGYQVIRWQKTFDFLILNPPTKFELHLKTNLLKVISKFQGKCGKPISATDTLIVRSFRTTSWTERLTGEN